MTCNNNMDNDNNNTNNIMSQRKLLQKIREYAFSVNDLSLYLDTHPCDQRALMAHKEYSEKLKKLKKIYEENYGPLTIYCPQNTWQWIEDSWPWEKRGV